jgi:hypothetical protein
MPKNGTSRVNTCYFKGRRKSFALEITCLPKTQRDLPQFLRDLTKLEQEIKIACPLRFGRGQAFF